jgi:hypothetical protein
MTDRLKRNALSLACVLSLLLLPMLASAVSNQYIILESPISFQDSGGTVTFALSNVLQGTGQYSARHDRTNAARTPYYFWRCTVQLTGINVPGAQIEIWLSTSDGTNADGQLGTVTALLPTDKRNNLKLLGTVTADQAATNVSMTASGEFMTPSQYLTLAVWNGTTLPTRNSPNTSTCSITPYTFQSQ